MAAVAAAAADTAASEAWHYSERPPQAVLAAEVGLYRGLRMAQGSYSDTAAGAAVVEPPCC